MKNVIIFVTALFVVAGCSAKIGNSKLETNRSAIEKQMSDKSTKTDIREQYGTPNLIFDQGGRETYEYKVINGAGRYHWMIPVWGWIAPIWQDSYTFKETNLFVTFDKNDKIKDWKIIQTSGTTD